MNFFNRIRYWFFTNVEMATQDKKVEIPEETTTSDKYLYFKKFDAPIETYEGTKTYSEIIACTGKDNKCHRFVKINNFVAK